MDKASITESVDSGSIPGRVKPKTIKIGIGAATKGSQGGGALPNNNFATPQTAQHASQTPLTLAAYFQDGGFFFGDQQRTRRKLDRVNAMTFFFRDQQKTRRKLSPFFFW